MNDEDANDISAIDLFRQNVKSIGSDLHDYMVGYAATYNPKVPEDQQIFVPERDEADPFRQPIVIECAHFPVQDFCLKLLDKVHYWYSKGGLDVAVKVGMRELTTNFITVQDYYAELEILECLIEKRQKLIYGPGGEDCDKVDLYNQLIQRYAAFRAQLLAQHKENLELSFKELEDVILQYQDDIVRVLDRDKQEGPAVK